MKAVSVFSSVVAAIGALVFAVWFGRDSTSVPLPRITVAEEIPTPSKTGPHPKAVMDETEYDFGLMQQGEKSKHVFIVRNEGAAPLKMVSHKKDSTCQCTVGKLGQDGLQPGESTEVTLSWHIKSRSPIFQHRAVVRTNDPERTQIPLTVRGKVGKLLVLKPEMAWTFGQVGGERATEVTGSLYSELVDEFKILKIDSSSPMLSAEFEPMPKEELEKLAVTMTFPLENQSPIQASLPVPKSGYTIRAKVQAGIPVGGFQERLTFHTDIKKAATRSIYVNGQRAGPYEIFHLENCFWSAKSILLGLGRFPAAEGRSAKAMMFVRDMKEDMQILEIKTQPKFLIVKIDRDAEFTSETTQRYLMTIDVAPGSPPVNHNRANRARISIKTNHPTAPLLDIRVEFVSTASSGP